MGTYNIAVIKGDGIGPEVTGAAQRIIAAKKATYYGIGMAHHEAFHTRVETDQEPLFVAPGIGMLFENDLCAAKASEKPRENAAVLHAMNDGVPVPQNEPQSFEEEKAVESQLQRGGADGDFFGAEQVGGPQDADALNGAVLADGQRQKIDAIPVVSECHEVEAQPDG